MKTNQSGFTLIELMVTVAIVVILAAVAWPSYQAHVRKSRRAEAQAFLMSVSVREQQFLVDTRSYTASLAGIGVPVPANVQLGYDLSLAATQTTFTVTASPKSIQSGERCGTMSINQTGSRMASVSGCW